MPGRPETICNLAQLEERRGSLHLMEIVCHLEFRSYVWR